MKATLRKSLPLVASALTLLAVLMSQITAAHACRFSCYQPQEPANLRERLAARKENAA